MLGAVFELPVSRDRSSREACGTSFMMMRIQMCVERMCDDAHTNVYGACMARWEQVHVFFHHFLPGCVYLPGLSPRGLCHNKRGQ